MGAPSTTTIIGAVPSSLLLSSRYGVFLSSAVNVAKFCSRLVVGIGFQHWDLDANRCSRYAHHAKDA
jgi:hypothetical protein